jgi:hypothetical protein
VWWREGFLTEEQLDDIRDGLIAEAYWWRLIREWSWEEPRPL